MGRQESWLLWVVLAGVASGEYTWTGTEWKWEQNEKKGTDWKTRQNSEDIRDTVLGGDVWEGYGDEGYEDDDSGEFGANYYYDDDYLVHKQSRKDMEEGSGSRGFGGNSWRDRVTQPLRRVENAFRPAGEEGELHVDQNTQYVLHNEDFFFGRDDEEENRNRVVVLPVERKRLHNDAKPTDSTEVHMVVAPTRNVFFFAPSGILAAIIGGAVVG